MAVTKTIEESRRDAETSAEEAARTIERLEEERRAVAPEALAGDTAAGKELARIEGGIAEARRRIELSESALTELDKRAEDERRRADERHREELSGRYDELARGRKKLLSEVEKALDALDKKATALLEHDREQRSVAEDLGRQAHTAPYGFIVRDRILSRLGGLLVGVPGAASGRHAPLIEDEWFTRTIAEEEAAKEEALERVEEDRREAERVREENERAEKIEQRRYELLSARMDWRHGTLEQRREIEEEAERTLAQEFAAEEA